MKTYEFLAVLISFILIAGDEKHLFANAAFRNMVENFKYDAGSGRRQGQATLTLDPLVEDQKTVLDFNLNQKGVRTMNRMRLIIQYLRESNELPRAQYKSVVLQLEVPDSGYTNDPGIMKLYQGRQYRDYRTNGGELGLNGYVEELLLDETLEELHWQRNDSKTIAIEDGDIFLDQAVQTVGQEGEGDQQQPSDGSSNQEDGQQNTEEQQKQDDQQNDNQQDQKPEEKSEGESSGDEQNAE